MVEIKILKDDDVKEIIADMSFNLWQRRHDKVHGNYHIKYTATHNVKGIKLNFDLERILYEYDWGDCGFTICRIDGEIFSYSSENTKLKILAKGHVIYRSEKADELFGKLEDHYHQLRSELEKKRELEKRDRDRRAREIEEREVASIITKIKGK